ncbi:MAG: A24 family peptidase [Alphaproteobacteria bacterium]|nr:A24 family peptidase [Alphaproteobacteria bacterium]
MSFYLAGEWIWPVIAAPFVGSFLGVLVLRLPAGKPVGLARSACPHCGATLGAAELVPLASWLMLRGRCRHCSAALGRFYPGIEIAALGIAVWAALALPAPLVWAGCALGWTLLAAALIDLRHLVLPDALVLPLIPAGIALHALVAPDRWPDHAIGAAAGYLGFVAVRALYSAIRRREGLGLGDAKLLAAAGAWVGWQGLPSVVFLGAAVALAGLVAVRGAGHDIDLRREIPFGPALALAIWVVWLYGPLVAA